MSEKIQIHTFKGKITKSSWNWNYKTFPKSFNMFSKKLLLFIVLDSGTREPLTRTRTESFARNRNWKFENSPYPEPNRNRLNTRRVPDGS